MSRIYRLLRAEQGVAMITVMLAIFILTVMVSALAIATMGESTLSFDQLRGRQALSVAEAGAYRALAELRRRVEEDLSLQIGSVSSQDPVGTQLALNDMCRQQGTPARRTVDVIHDYAYPVALGASDWVLTGPDSATATLSIGLASDRVRMIVDGEEAGDFYAIIAVRGSGRQADAAFRDADCVLTGVTVQFRMWFDYAILAVGRTRNATRAVCLRSPGADSCADWFPVATAAPEGSYVLSGGTVVGWPVLVENPSFASKALMLMDVGDVFLYTGTTINGPVHSNSSIRIAGNPILNDAVSQVDASMLFGNCDPGHPLAIAIPGTTPNATLRTPCDNTSGNVFRSTVTVAQRIDPPSGAIPSRASIGLSPQGLAPTDDEIRNRTSTLGSTDPVADGVYVMDECPSPPCAAGIYIRGDVQQMVLSSEGGKQVIRITTSTAPDRNGQNRQNTKIIIDPITKSVTACWAFVGPDGGADCSGWGSSAVYSSLIFNGVVYVSGSITYDPDPSASTGVHGMVNQDTALTIAAENDISITGHLVYEIPPVAQGHNPANVLGLWAVTGQVTIEGALTPHDLYIDAAILAPSPISMPSPGQGGFWVRGWNSLPVRGNIYHLGGTVQGRFGAFGGFSPDTGYGRVMTYDWRLRSNIAPPGFPRLPTLAAPRPRWPSPADVFQTGDPLYDRPQWEEMVGS